eukprot:5586601-Pleurochrysis_carterae.AAC.1
MSMLAQFSYACFVAAAVQLIERLKDKMKSQEDRLSEKVSDWQLCQMLLGVALLMHGFPS